MVEKVVKSRVVQIDSQKTWNMITSKLMHQTTIPVIMYFTAAWCKPAMTMKPVFEEQAMIHKDTLFLSVDVDDVKGVMKKMQIKAMPTFIMIKLDNKQKGKVMDKVVGANPNEVKKRIAAFIHSAVTSSNSGSCVTNNACSIRVVTVTKNSDCDV
ncbi:thioredoxin-like protein CXXS1 [Rutidosis leptorrhynchoides]|uniref:thioredoxin-like protein CXXS1 n=1 Tax=Rutidosis leptorrhynchoides TaxID=125765 RepID=UPI003A992E6B